MSSAIKAVISRFSKRLKADLDEAKELLKKKPLPKEDLAQLLDHIESSVKT